MATARTEPGPKRYGTIIFHCDEDGCDQQEDTGYTTWDYAKECIKREGWYIMPADDGGWLHLCPCHGKARWIARKTQERAA